MKKILLILGVVATTFYACSEEEVICTPIWQKIASTQTTIIEVDTENEELSLQVQDPLYTTGDIYQPGISGDFEAIATFKNWSPGAGPNPYAAFTMYSSTIADTVLDTIVVSAGITRGRIFANVGVLDSVSKPTNATSGIFRIRRQGGAITAQTIAGTDTVTFFDFYAANPNRIGFRFGTLGLPAPGVTGIKITQLVVIGSNGTIKSDDFLCNTILQ